METEQNAAATPKATPSAPAPQARDFLLVALVKTLLNWNYLKMGTKKAF